MNQKYLYGATSGMEAFTNGAKPDVAGIFDATAENIASFIVQNREAPNLFIDTLTGLPLLTANFGFVNKMYDQKYHMEELMPVLVPMQLDEREVAMVELHESRGFDVGEIPVVDYNAYSDYLPAEDWPGFRQRLLADDGEDEAHPDLPEHNMDTLS